MPHLSRANAGMTSKQSSGRVGRPDKGSYTYAIRVNGRVIGDGQVDDHVRELGWQGLLEAVAKDGRVQASTRIHSMVKVWDDALTENLHENTAIKRK